MIVQQNVTSQHSGERRVRWPTLEALTSIWYPDWRGEITGYVGVQMKHLLRSMNLWGYVDGSVKLAIDADPDTKAKFEEKQQDAVTMLILAMTTRVATSVESYECPINFG